MTAHILVVEDDPDYIRDIEDVLRTLSPGREVKVARSRDSAFTLLSAEFFDIVVLDLNIPTSDAMLDGDSQHGFAVFPGGHPNCPTPGHPNCSTWPG